MATLTNTCTRDEPVAASVMTPPVDLKLGLLTGGGDKPYAFGLATALTSKGVHLDFIGSDELDSPELRSTPNLRFLNLRGSQSADAGFAAKILRILTYYVRLIAYAAGAKPKVLHVLWNNKFQTFDRTVLMLWYRLCGKRIVLTVHNVNAARRDASDSLLNRLTLRAQYRLADHLFVHTDRMKRELVDEFGVRESSVTTIPLGVNNSVPTTTLTPAAAKRRLGIHESDKTILFYGHIGPYKGLEHLVAAFQQVAATDPAYRLIIAGRPKTGADKYWDEIQRSLRGDASGARVIQRIEFIPDEETELYFKAADVLALPYTHVFQSGVIVLGYTFGLPVVSTDVGSLAEDIVEGRTGFLCRPCDPVDLARAIEAYFASDLFRALDSRRQEIRDFVQQRRSWDAISQTTLGVYAQLRTTGASE